MKVTAYCSFDFRMEMDLETIEALMILSARHYDITCREASGEKGFYRYWKNSVQSCVDHPFEDEKPYVYTKWRELDISMKICEQAVFNFACKRITKNQLQLIDKFRAGVTSLFNKVHTEYTPWINKFNEQTEYPSW